jgi:organic hydroperoxide reductase OsmC/OhrA
MKMRARVQNTRDSHQVVLQTNDDLHELMIAPKPAGFGSSVNGGELLFLALATCYCNDIYREAAKRGIVVERVEVTVDGDFPAEGAAATNVSYHATVAAQASEEAIRSLMRDTDQVAEIQNTLRAPTPVRLSQIEAVPV